MRRARSYQEITLAKENTQILKRATKRGLHSSQNPKFWEVWGVGTTFCCAFQKSALFRV